MFRHGFATLDSFGHILPHGGVQSTCILQSLHDALALRGPLNDICEIVSRVQKHQRIMSYPISSMPSCYKGIQTAVMKILSIDESCTVDLNYTIWNKCYITCCL